MSRDAMEGREAMKHGDAMKQGKSSEMEVREEMSEELESALRNFRASVKSWSEAEYARPRAMGVVSWWSLWHRRVGAFALGCCVVVVGAGVPLLVHRHEHEQAQAAAAQRRAEQQREQQMAAADEQKERGAGDVGADDAFLTDVDSDIAQATPEALEPIASLMDETQPRQGARTAKRGSSALRVE